MNDVRRPPGRWILVADGARARLLAQADRSERLIEVACFAHPQGRSAGRELDRDRPPRVNESVGELRHAIERHTSAREKSDRAFAATLVAALAQGHADRRFARLVVAAPPRFLGALRAALPASLASCIEAEFAHDWVTLAADEIDARIGERPVHGRGAPRSAAPLD